MNADELVALNEQIAAMARAGLPLDEGLSSLAREMGRGRLKNVTAALGQDLARGRSLPEALELRRDQLPPYYASLATAGIRTGRLPDVLCTLTDYARTIAATRSMITEALAYPAMIFGFGLLVFGFLAFVVIPQFETIYLDFKLTIPPLTKFALFVGRHPLQYFLVPATILVATFVFMRFLCRRTHTGIRLWTRLVYSTPLLGSLIQSARLAAFVDLLGVLVKYNVPLPEAFQLAGDACSDPLIADQSQDMRVRLENGVTLGDALSGGKLLPEWVAWMAKSGERRGELAETLQQIAGVYRRHVEARANVLRNMLPSMLMIFVAGCLTMLFVVSLLLPLISMIEGLSK